MCPCSELSRTTERLISSEDLSTRDLLKWERRAGELNTLRYMLPSISNGPCYIELDSASHESSSAEGYELG